MQRNPTIAARANIMTLMIKSRTLIILILVVFSLLTPRHSYAAIQSSPVEVKINLMLGDNKFIMYDTAGKGLAPYGEYDLYVYEKKLFTVRLEEVGENYALALILPPAGYFDIEGKTVQLLLKSGSYQFETQNPKIKKLPPATPKKPEPKPVEKPKIKREVIDVSKIDTSMESAKPAKKPQPDPKIAPPVTSSIIRFDSTSTDGKADSNIYTAILAISDKKKDNVRSGFLMLRGNYQSSESKNDAIGIGMSFTHFFDKNTWGLASYTYMTSRNSQTIITDTESGTFYAGLYNKFSTHNGGKSHFKASLGASSDSGFNKNRYISGTLYHNTSFKDTSNLVLAYRNTYNYDLKTHMSDAYSVDFTIPFLKKSKLTFGYKRTDKDEDVFGYGAKDSDTYKVVLYTKH